MDDISMKLWGRQSGRGFKNCLRFQANKFGVVGGMFVVTLQRCAPTKILA
jgi:hypothetical protein